ncbi:hypothetical protein MNBD_GAMMA10-3152 [hydrothermal vent metagenome]|uniref:Uncharacterized protein n=1 Tax=hydrothermal vent metagenome TaxID=652676 RepID=A0A3B0Y0S3_9ZZZZ
MNNFTDRQLRLKRYARLLLGLFILSAMNMGVQIPAHAAMLQVMDGAYLAQPQGMTQMDAQSCECPPVLCISVVSLGDQVIDSLHEVSFAHLTGFRSAYTTTINNNHHQHVSSQLSFRDRLYRQSNPPPLSITRILHI